MTTTWAVRDGRAVWSGRFLDEWVDDVVTQVVRIVNPTAVWLFGSVARGDDDGDSDIDLLVVLAGYDPSQSLDLKLTVHRTVTTPVPFDVVFTSSDRLAERVSIAGTVERIAVREGRLIYGRA